MKLQTLCFIRNSLALLIFAMLAIHFDKWWIVFFAAVFWCWVE